MCFVACLETWWRQFVFTNRLLIRRNWKIISPLFSIFCLQHPQKHSRIWHQRPILAQNCRFFIYIQCQQNTKCVITFGFFLSVFFSFFFLFVWQHFQNKVTLVFCTKLQQSCKQSSKRQLSGRKRQSCEKTVGPQDESQCLEEEIYSQNYRWWHPT